MFSYKSRYCVAAAMAAMAALTGHVEARDIDLQSIGYFQFSPLPTKFGVSNGYIATIR